MSKKNFKSGFDSLLGGATPASCAHPPKKIAKELRATFIVKQDSLDKLKTISFWKRQKIKTTLEEALTLYIKNYEDQNGVIHVPDKDTSAVI